MPSAQIVEPNYIIDAGFPDAPTMFEPTQNKNIIVRQSMKNNTTNSLGTDPRAETITT